MVQILSISQSVDAYSLVMGGQTTGWRIALGYLGQVAKWAVLACVIAAVLLKNRWPQYAQALVRHMALKRFIFFTFLQWLAFSVFWYFTHYIFASNLPIKPISVTTLAGWLGAGGLTLLWALLALVPLRQLGKFLHTQWVVLGVACLLAGAVWLTTQVSANFWGPMGEATFFLANLWLELLGVSHIYLDPANKVMGVNDFYVHVANACSGYEGIGLIVAFTAVYIWVHKREFRFPQAFLLFPLGALCIWWLNSVRIALLVLLGGTFSPEVAVGGFHSQAGWLTFIVTSVGLLWLAGKSAFFAVKSEPLVAPKVLAAPSEQGPQQAIAVLVPIIVLLLSTLITSTFSHGGMDWLYPVRVIAVVVALWLYWPHFAWPAIQWQRQPMMLSGVVGVGVAIFWVFLLGDQQKANAQLAQGLASVPSWVAGAWLLVRAIGAVVTVPIAEELAFRGYLLCQLTRTEVYVKGPWPTQPWGRMALAIGVSSLAFGFLHGAWVAGTLAGVAYAVVRVRSTSVIAPIVAHSLTNALLFIYAAVTGHWGVL